MRSPRRSSRSLVLLVAGLLLAGPLAITGNLAATNLPRPLEWTARYAWLLFLGCLLLAAVVGVGRHLLEVYTEAPVVPRRPDLERRDRRRMLERVRLQLNAQLAQSLGHLARMELGLQTRPEAVELPMSLLLRRRRNAQLLPPGTRIGAAFDELDKALLILGEPGAGKTTLLVELARDLLDRALRDETEPIPVVVNLASWASRRSSLTDWLVDELALQYRVPRRLGQAWVDEDQVLPLLDGLDEVANAHRAGCVTAINIFRQKHGLLPMAVCCRIEDYEGIAARIELEGAVEIQPPTRQQVHAYLQQVGTPLESLRAALAAEEDEDALWELLQSPLMLSIVTLALREQPKTVLPTSNSLEKQHTHIFDAYVEAMFARRISRPAPYSRSRTLHSLSWLARVMAEHNQSEFHLDRLQPSWLPKRGQRWLVLRGPAVLGRIVLGLLVGMLAGIVTSFCAVFVDPASSLTLEQRPTVGASYVLLFGLRAGVLAGCLTGLGLGIVTGTAKSIGHSGSPQLPYRTFRRRVLLVPACLIIIGPIVALFLGLQWELRVAVAIGVVASGLFGLSVIHLGLPRDPPNDEIALLGMTLAETLRRSAVAALRFGLVIAIPTAYVMGSSVGLVDGLAVGAITGAVGGLWAGFQRNGSPCLQYLLLHALLAREGGLPLRHIRLLDYGVDRILLRRVGRSYRFMHRLLLEHFATLPPW